VYGISEVQIRLQMKEYHDYKEIGLLIDEYFTHGRDNHHSQIDMLRYQMKKWFDSH